MTSALPVAYDLNGAADAVSVSEDTVRREIHAGRLRARKIGRKYYVARVDLEAWFDNLPEAS